jgi:hypothetical protein
MTRYAESAKFLFSRGKLGSYNDEEQNTASNSDSVGEKNPFGSFDDEQQSDGSGSELKSDSFSSDDLSSTVVMAASAMPTYESGDVPPDADRPDWKQSQSDSSAGTQSALTEPHSNSSVNGNSRIEASSSLSSARSQKMESANYWFKKSALISGEPLEEVDNSKDGPHQNKDSDVESGPPDSDYAPRAPRSLWHEISLDSDADDKGAESVIEDELDATNEKKPGGDDGWPNYREFLLKYRAILAGVAVLVVVIIIIVIVLVATGGGDDNNKGGTPSSMEAMHDKIEETVSQLVDPEILSNRNSPEAQALKWLIEDDTVWRHQHEDFSVERIVQRFVLVSFYLSRGGPLYWKANNWLQGEECTWNFIDCNGIGEVRALAFGKFRFCCCVRTKQKAESSNTYEGFLFYAQTISA